ncbi:MAG TPA: HAMP domain-containing sensor histidine kinase [Candidatus Limnocylindrales bacterium]|nr:HAMP domain-containing sensor histidine kinase [Candidatus Limnocylindrales bacterium]
MIQAAILAQDLTAAGFVALGVAIGYRWYRGRGRAEGRLALALGSLALVAAVGRLPQSLPLSVVAVVAFMLSGYFVLLFRHEFIPLGRRARRAADVLLAISIVAGLLDVIIQGGANQTVVTALGFVLIAVWAIFAGEPIIRFWLASNRLPAVQKARMRFLSFGFGVLIVILFVDVLGGAALRSPTAIVITQLLALAVVPAIYVSFAPPSLLRRIWRMGEEDAVRSAMQDLLVFSPTRKDLAERAAFWAVRLLGATSGFIVDAQGKVIASTGIDPEAAAQVYADDKAGHSGRVILAPLHLADGEGSLAVMPGAFTPVFGTDEISQLRAYASSVSAGLQRVGVTERLAAIEKNKSQFLNLASHELRGPVTVIRGYVSMLEDGMLGQLNERGRKAADVMASKVSEMNEMIEEMIDAARLEEGGITLRTVDSDLRDIVRDAVETVAPLAEARHRIEVDLPDRKVRVKVDPDRTRTIVANLLSNAIKYSPDGGTVTCQVRVRAGIARVAVTDEGVGIARESLPTLFTRFGRVITPRTEHLKGTGLGLFLARQLARIQGGDITVASVEGKGSTFTLQLPAAGSPDGSAELADRAAVDTTATPAARDMPESR